MSKLREAAERVLATVDSTAPGFTSINHACIALRAALSETDLEGAVVEAAKAWHFTRTSANVCRVMCTVDALLVSQRPSATVRCCYRSDPAETWVVDYRGRQAAQFYNGSGYCRAQTDAEDYAAKLNNEPRP